MMIGYVSLDLHQRRRITPKEIQNSLVINETTLPDHQGNIELLYRIFNLITQHRKSAQLRFHISSQYER
jgi:hypothetical protein